MIGVVESVGEWVTENGGGFLESYAVLGEITGGLVFIPLKTHAPNIAASALDS